MSDLVEIRLRLPSCDRCPYCASYAADRNRCVLLSETVNTDEGIPSHCPIRVDRATEDDDWSCNAHGESTSQALET